MRDVMVDLETLGTKPGSVILSIGAVAFDETGLGEKFYRVISLTSSLEAGLTEDPDTKLWWSQQNEEARLVLDQATDARIAVPLAVALTEFTQWVELISPLKEIKMWGNGSDFDNVMLASAYAAVGKALPWRFYNNRCYRTLKSLLNLPLQRSGTHHNALDDAVTQANHAVWLLRRLRYGEQSANREESRQAPAQENSNLG